MARNSIRTPTTAPAILTPTTAPRGWPEPERERLRRRILALGAASVTAPYLMKRVRELRSARGEMKQIETEITLEQYLHFYDHGCGANLSRFHLNQIIYMHGFMKLHRLHKRNLMELLEAIELAPPRRSTLLGRRGGASARAPLTAAETAEDVAALGWEECPTPESPADQELVAGASKLRRRRRGGGGGGGGEGSGGWAPPPADFVVRGRRPRSKRKRASINALTAASSATGPAEAGSSSPSTVSSAPPPPPPLRTRSRTPPQLSSPFLTAPLSPSSSPSPSPF